MNDCKTFFMVGAGNVAWHLSQALKTAGFIPTGVYSRHKNKADTLANILQCKAYDNFDKVKEQASLFVISVKDDAITDVFEKAYAACPDSFFIHTAGSVSIDVFKNKAKSYGVLYPLQSFSIKRDLDFNNIPIFIEGNNNDTTSLLFCIATKISKQPITVLNSEQRKIMHLAAVFASNFTNHCYACAKQLLEESGVKFSALLPLIDETCKKVHELSPEDAQTGPAVRYDKTVMSMQEKMLHGAKLDIYRSISRSIHETATKTTENK